MDPLLAAMVPSAVGYGTDFEGWIKMGDKMGKSHLLVIIEKDDWCEFPIWVDSSEELYNKIENLKNRNYEILSISLLKASENQLIDGHKTHPMKLRENPRKPERLTY